MHILIVKTSSLGDIVQSFPVIDYLRSKLPDAKIDWVVESPYAELVESHPDIHRVIKIATKDWRRLHNWAAIPGLCRELREQEYAAVFDLQGNLKSGVITFLARSKHKVGFGPASISERPNLLFTHHRYDPPKGMNVRHENLYLVQSYFQDFTVPDNRKVQLHVHPQRKERIDQILPSGTKVLVCPGSAWNNKKISKEALMDFLSLLHKNLNCFFLLAWGNKAEKEEAELLQQKMTSYSSLIEKLPLPELQYLMKNVDLILAMDSLPLHLGATTSTPTFSVFGASSANKYQPLGQQHLALQGTCPYGETFERRCPILRTCSTGACMKNFTGEELYRAFEKSGRRNLT